MTIERRAVLPAACATLLSLAPCGRFESGSTVAAPAQAAVGRETIAAIPLGDVAGADSSELAASIRNPYGDANPQAVQQGKELSIRMNCAGCHGCGLSARNAAPSRSVNRP